MLQRFFITWLAVYLVNSLSGYLIHHIILAEDYRTMTAVWQSDARSRILFFIISSVIGSFFLTLVYAKWQKMKTVSEGALYGLFIGLWMGSNMALNTYASSNLIPFSLSMKWLVLSMIQYTIDGCILGLSFKLFAQRNITV